MHNCKSKAAKIQRHKDTKKTRNPETKHEIIHRKIYNRWEGKITMQLFKHQQQARDFAVSTFRKAIHRHYCDKNPLNCGAA
ncbi:MAG: hypothetical protein VZR33_09860, partial [Methanosphaera sp.]|nr:hypothetical protein [Methanosphaera sp.]